MMVDPPMVDHMAMMDVRAACVILLPGGFGGSRPDQASQHHQGGREGHGPAEWMRHGVLLKNLWGLGRQL
jgi:hypothetical protein